MFFLNFHGNLSKCIFQKKRQTTIDTFTVTGYIVVMLIRMLIIFKLGLEIRTTWVEVCDGRSTTMRGVA